MENMRSKSAEEPSRLWAPLKPKHGKSWINQRVYLYCLRTPALQMHWIYENCVPVISFSFSTEGKRGCYNNQMAMLCSTTVWSQKQVAYFCWFMTMVNVENTFLRTHCSVWGFCCLFFAANIVPFSLEKKGTAWADHSYEVGNHINSLNLLSSDLVG